jgi:hypothetical protein
MGFGKKLKQLGKQKFGTLKRFAEAWEIHEPSLQKYINEEQEPGRAKLAKLIPLGFDLNYLLDDNATLNGHSTLREKSIDYHANTIESLHSLCIKMEELYYILTSYHDFENPTKHNKELVLLLRWMERICETSLEMIRNSIESEDDSFININDKKMLEEVISQHKNLLSRLKNTNTEIELSINYKRSGSETAG